ncbi:MAG: hypothetical protein WD989_00090 [Candidatus Paceibacterota bacterium]
MELQLPATIRVTHNNGRDELRPERDGYLGSDLRENFRLEIAPSGGLYWALKAKANPFSDKKFDLVLMRSKIVGSKQVYIKDVAVSPSENSGELPTTKWPKNHVKFIQVSPDHRLQLWEVGVITQISEERTSNFFLVSQLVYGSRICQNQSGEICLPDWAESSEWPLILEQLGLFLNPKMLPLFDDRQKIPSEPAPKIRGNTGVVKWYNLAYQIGVIAMKDKDARIHWKKIDSKDRLKALQEGQKVRVREVRPATNSYQSPRVTKFEFDALGVSPVRQK